MKAIAIMQPAYMPWAGYFNLITSADIFVILDDVQFQRSSWQCRNRILLEGKEAYLTVPVRRTGLLSRLDDVMIDYARDWRKSHEGMVRQAYSQTTGGVLVIDALISAWVARPERLLDLNLMIIRSLMNILKIGSDLLSSSKLGAAGKRSDRLIEICHILDATDYLSPAGAEEYLIKDGFQNQSSVSLHLQNFVPHPYRQARSKSFVPYMSVVDVIANLGPDLALEYVRRPSFETYSRSSLQQQD